MDYNLYNAHFNLDLYILALDDIKKDNEILINYKYGGK